MKRLRFYWFLLGCLLWLGVQQSTAQGTLGETDIQFYTLGGGISLQSHAYSTSRGNNRREPLGVLATANLNFSVLGFRSGLNMRISTDDSSFRQDMNQFSFSAGWNWISVNAGDVSPVFNQYSLRGTRVRGGEIELSPGAFTAHFTAGQVNRRSGALPGSRRQLPTFERWLYGGRLGIGSPTRSNFFLGIVYAKDVDEPLLGPPGDPIGDNRPTPTPEENLTISPDFQISLFSQKLTLQAENSLSVFTRNTRSNELDLGEAGAPEFTNSLYDARTSSRINFATNVSTRLNLSPFTLNLGFERVQPGYRSMGLRNVKDDDQSFLIQPSVVFLDGRLNVSSNLRFGRDNLLNQRISTQNRSDYGLNVQSQITQNFSFGMGYNLLLNSIRSDVSAGEDTSFNYPEQTISSHNLNMQPVYSWAAESASHSVALSVNLQQLDMDIENQDRDFGSSFFSGTATYSLGFFSGFNVNTSLNYAGGESANSDFGVIGGNVGLGHSFFDRAVSVNLNGGLSRNTTESLSGTTTNTISQQQFTGNFTAMYRPTRMNTIRLSARSMNNALLQGTGSEFQEFELRLSVDQRF